MGRLYFANFLVAANCLLVASRPADAQQLVPGGFFRDDFADGNARDFEPAQWIRGVSWDADEDNVIDADLHILGSRGISVVVPVDRQGDWLSYDDSVVLAQMRIIEPTELGLIGVFARSVPERSYFGGIDSAGQVFVGGPDAIITQIVSTDIDPVVSDVLVQLELAGDEVGLTVWSEGEPKPSTPQLSFVDDNLSSGTFGAFVTSISGTPVDGVVRWIEVAEQPPQPVGLRAGDADQDFDFDQSDIVQVLASGKFLTAQPATWGEGDWNGAPGGQPGNPPAGDGRFDQLDIIAALSNGLYSTGPYGALVTGGVQGDGQASVGYDPVTDEVFVDAPAGTELASMNIDSVAGVSTGAAAQNLGDSFNNDAENNIFKATSRGSFETLSFGNVIQTGLTRDFVRSDLAVIGSLAGGGDLGDVDLIYVSEPSSCLALALGLLGLGRFWRKRIRVGKHFVGRTARDAVGFRTSVLQYSSSRRASQSMTLKLHGGKMRQREEKPSRKSLRKSCPNTGKELGM